MTFIDVSPVCQVLYLHVLLSLWLVQIKSGQLVWRYFEQNTFCSWLSVCLALKETKHGWDCFRWFDSRLKAWGHPLVTLFSDWVKYRPGCPGDRPFQDTSTEPSPTSLQHRRTHRSASAWFAPFTLSQTLWPIPLPRPSSWHILLCIHISLTACSYMEATVCSLSLTSSSSLMLRQVYNTQRVEVYLDLPLQNNQVVWLYHWSVRRSGVERWANWVRKMWSERWISYYARVMPFIHVLGCQSVALLPSASFIFVFFISGFFGLSVCLTAETAAPMTCLSKPVTAISLFCRYKHTPTCKCTPTLALTHRVQSTHFSTEYTFYCVQWCTVS